MTAPQASARIFMSYATADAAAYAADLRRNLEARGHTIWHDVAALEAGRDWWTQIEVALKSEALQHVVLILTPAALSLTYTPPGTAPGTLRPVIRDEIHLAREQGKSIIPVRGPGLNSVAKLPRHIGQVLDLARPEHSATFLGMLDGASRQKPVPMMVSEPPKDFVARPAEFEALKALLLAPDTKEAVAITAALRGSTGYGKTTLARALAYDADIRDAYYDGALFVELGQQGRERIVAVIADIVGLIDPERRRDFSTVDGAKTALGEALGNRRFLLVIDDVWRRADLLPFLHGGPSTTRLITTRFAGELPAEVAQERVAAMTGGADGEAWRLLAAGLPLDQVVACKAALVALAERRHNWPQALRLASGFLRTRMGLSRHRGRARATTFSLAAAIEAANAGLDAKGGVALDPNRLKPAGGADERYDQRHTSVAEGMELNLSLLDDANRIRFSELGVFPEDVDVPIGIAARLWAEAGGLDRHDTEALLAACDDASLLLDLDFERGTFRFHDSVREYLHDLAGKAGLAALHKRLIHAMGEIGGAAATPAAEAEYFYRHLPQHLAAAEERAALDALLLDPGWLRAKLAAINSPISLVSDYEQHGTCLMHRLIGRTLRLTTGICAREHRQLLPQLLGRLIACSDPSAPRFLGEARRLVSRPALLSICLSLTPPGAETARLEGHTGDIMALALLPNGRLASGAGDSTIRLWDIASGAETGRIEGHTRGVNALALLPDGRLASGSDDTTVRLWDLATGSETARLEGHAGAVMALELLPDGRLASASGDSTVRMWDVATGAEIARLEGHTDWVGALTLLPDGRLASGSDDGTVRLWDLATCTEAGRLDGHAGWISALAVLPDGRLAFASDDCTVRVWDLSTGAEAACLEGHTGWVRELALLPDGRLASGAGDSTVRLWDVATGSETARLEGHAGWISALALLPDGRLASGSADSTVRLWDLATGSEIVRNGGHTDWIGALALLPDGRLASGSEDSTVRLWDLATGSEIACLEGHNGGVRALALLPDGRLAAASGDSTVCVWNLATGTEIASLKGHTGGITALALLPDGRLASASDDRTVRLWDLTTGSETARLEGHRGAVMALAPLPSGRLASASGDSTVFLWDLATGSVTARIEGHTGGIMALALLPDGRLASASDDRTIRLWDLATGSETTRLEGHNGGVMALALLPGRLASASGDRSVRLWDLVTGKWICRLEVDAAVLCLAALPDSRLVAGDQIGRLHWLEVVD